MSTNQTSPAHVNFLINYEEEACIITLSMSFNLATLVHRAQNVSNDAFYMIQSKVHALRPSEHNEIDSTFVPRIECTTNRPHKAQTYKWNSNSASIITHNISPDVALTILSYLDAASICRLQQMSRMWRDTILYNEARIWNVLAKRDFRDSRSCTLASYLRTQQRILELELKHMKYIEAPFRALEDYCTEERDHGIISMLCDICYFDDPRIGEAIASQRFGAMAMVIVQRPSHVQRFRKRSKYVGPINFVPHENPNWPEIELPSVNANGFLGYAFDLVQMIPEFEYLRPTVVRTILKDIAVFDTIENAVAARAIGYNRPYVTLDTTTPPFDLTFTSIQREELRTKSISDKIQIIERKIGHVQHSAAYINYGR